METVIDWIATNAHVLFSGIGVVVLAGVGKLVWSRFSPPDTSVVPQGVAPVTNNFYSSMELDSVESGAIQNEEAPVTIAHDLKFYQDRTRILFIDDDRHFKVVKILRNSGWVHTKLVKDIDTMNQQELVDAHILFVDVQGVGVSLGFGDEGLGLALAIKESYPAKKVIIYSAQTTGERFHKALQAADASLPKNADPYEFQQLVESCSAEVISG